MMTFVYTCAQLQIGLGKDTCPNAPIVSHSPSRRSIVQRVAANDWGQWADGQVGQPRPLSRSFQSPDAERIY